MTASGGRTRSNFIENIVWAATLAARRATSPASAGQAAMAAGMAAGATVTALPPATGTMIATGSTSIAAEAPTAANAAAAAPNTRRIRAKRGRTTNPKGKTKKVRKAAVDLPQGQSHDLHHISKSSLSSSKLFNPCSISIDNQSRSQ